MIINASRNHIECNFDHQFEKKLSPEKIAPHNQLNNYRNAAGMHFGNHIWAERSQRPGDYRNLSLVAEQRLDWTNEIFSAGVNIFPDFMSIDDINKIDLVATAPKLKYWQELEATERARSIIEIYINPSDRNFFFVFPSNIIKKHKGNHLFESTPAHKETPFSAETEYLRKKLSAEKSTPKNNSSEYKPSNNLCRYVIESSSASETTEVINEASQHIKSAIWSLFYTLSNSTRKNNSAHPSTNITDTYGIKESIAKALISRINLRFKYWNDFIEELRLDLIDFCKLSPIITAQWQLQLDKEDNLVLHALDIPVNPKIKNRAPPPIKQAKTTRYDAYDV